MQTEIAESDVSLWLGYFRKVLKACSKNRFPYFPAALRSDRPSRRFIIWGIHSSEKDLGFHWDVLRPFLEDNDALRDTVVVGVHRSEDLGTPNGLPYLSYAEFFADSERFRDALIVDRSCTWRGETPDKARLEGLGFQVVRFEQLLNAPNLVTRGYYRTHSDAVLENSATLLEYVDLFADNKSKCVYLQSLCAFGAMDFRFFQQNLNPFLHRYVPDDIGRPITDSEVFVDCGAYDGTDAINFAQRAGLKYRAIEIFEPDSGNYRTTADNITRFCNANDLDSIYLHRCGVSDANIYVSFSGSGQGVAASGANVGAGPGIFLGRLDDLIDDATWIKLEVEGSELAALRGAARLIASRRPTVTVSVYHKPSDYLDIVPYLRDDLPAHRLFVRHYSMEAGTLAITAVPKT